MMIGIGVSVQLLKLKPDPRTMKDLGMLGSQNLSNVYCTQWHHISEDGKVGNILHFFRGFLMY